MDTDAQRQKRRDIVLSSLNVAIEGLNIAEKISSITPAKAVFSTVSVILTMIKDSMINEVDYVELGLACANVCNTLDRGLSRKRLDDLNDSVREAIGQLTTTVGDIQRKVIKQGKRNAVSRLFHAKNDKEVIATWRLDLNRILHIFNTELAINTHVAVTDIHDGVTNMHTTVSEVQHDTSNTYNMVSDMHRHILKNQEGTDDKNRLTQSSIPGESAPSAPRTCFGRGELIEKIVGLVEDLTPLALMGAGGIGKTSIALTVLHDNRVKERFGDNRRFIRCDQFPVSRTHLLSRLSKVIGAGIENPGDLAPLRPFLSSREIFIVLDNAESILDPQGPDAREIYAVVEELSQLSNICLCVTSRISIIPPDCEALDVPTLSMEAARDAFYRTYRDNKRSDLVDNILERLDFHPLSVTLLATVAYHNKWDTGRLIREWEQHRTGVLHTRHDKSLATTIELSLASPMFQVLGPSARALLEVVAFFPQGVNENNFDWFFPTIPDRTNIFDNFCILSLTHRNNGFITMLALLRDYFYPKDPKSSPLLCTTKECYFTRLSVDLDPEEPSFGEARWITSEDVNVEHLLDVFTTIDANSGDVWDACEHFMEHLYRHKKRLVVLGPKIEGLPDDHPSKPPCIYELSWLFESVGNWVERKRLLVYTLNLWKERGDEHQIAKTSRLLAQTSLLERNHSEGIRWAKEALEAHERLGEITEQARSLRQLARAFHQDSQFDAAEDAVSQALDLLPNTGFQYDICNCRLVLGEICRSRGEVEKATTHLEVALGIASSFNWSNEQFWIHYSLAELTLDQGRFDGAHSHIERAKSHAIYDVYHLGHATRLQAKVWYEQCRLGEAKSEALRAIDIYEKLGSSKEAKNVKKLLQRIEGKMNMPVG